MACNTYKITVHLQSYLETKSQYGTAVVANLKSYFSYDDHKKIIIKTINKTIILTQYTENNTNVI